MFKTFKDQIACITENSTFFWRTHGQKIPLRIHQNTPFQVWKKLCFSAEGAIGLYQKPSLPISYPYSPLSLRNPPLRPPEFQADLCQCQIPIVRFSLELYWIGPRTSLSRYFWTCVTLMLVASTDCWSSIFHLISTIPKLILFRSFCVYFMGLLCGDTTIGCLYA